MINCVLSWHIEGVLSPEWSSLTTSIQVFINPSLDGLEAEFYVGVVEETPSSTQESFNLDYNSTIAPNNFKLSRKW